MFEDTLCWLQHWYATCCSHSSKNVSIKIETLDNPGFYFTVSLESTGLENVKFVKVKFQDKNEDNWMSCYIRDKKFVGACGPRNLPQVLSVFRKWVEGLSVSLINQVPSSLKEDISTDHNKKNEDFTWLQNWFCYYCDGDWEHGYGIKIWTTEPFGWRVSIDLEMSQLEGCFFEEIDSHGVDEKDFVHCEVQNNKFEGTCGSRNLTQVVSFFRKWAEGLGQKVDTERTRFHGYFL